MFRLNVRRVFTISLLAAAIFAGTQYAPPLFYYWQFKDNIRQDVKFAAAKRQTTEDISRDVLDRAKEFYIPITARDIHITRRGVSFTLDVDYHWPVDLRVYQHDMKFH